MFHRTSNVNNDLKSESDRLCPAPPGVGAGVSSNYDERVTLASNSNSGYKPTPQYQSHLCNKPREETKSHNRPRNGNFHSLSQQANQADMHANCNNISSSNNNQNQRNSQQITRSTTNPQIYQQTSSSHHNNHQYYPATPFQQSTLSRTTNQLLVSESKNGNSPTSSRPLTQRQRTSSVNNIIGHYPQTIFREEATTNLTRSSALNPNSDQQERDSDEVVAVIREELENDNHNEFDEPETLGSLERNLPIELSFLIRQQANCIARMNYLERQIREMKEAKRLNPTAPPQISSTSSSNQSHLINRIAASNNINTTMGIKNGNFMPSDDSGGEYSRATVSDGSSDELSSLLDQIKNMSINHQHPRSTNYNVMRSHQPYAIINPSQLHHQAVPVFVMGSPIAVAHPASSISSTVLPGVHFQPEPRYNQYYEDFYVHNNTHPSSSTMHARHNGLNRSHQFDSNISAIEQLVNQKEKRQIKSQLKSADNWFKMHSSGLCNLNDNFSGSDKNNVGTSVAANNTGDVSAGIGGNSTDRNLPMASSSATLVNENSSGAVGDRGSR